MDFVAVAPTTRTAWTLFLSFYGLLSVRTVVGHSFIPSIFPLRSTLLRILPEGSIPMTPYVAILAPSSYSLYLGSHASFLRLLMALLSQCIRRTFFAPALQSFAHRLKSKFLYYLWFICSYLLSTCSFFVSLTGTYTML